MILPGVIASSGGVASSYESIATASGTGSSGTITFSSIPSTFAHLQIRAINNDTAGYFFYLQFNTDTTANYTIHQLIGNGTTASAYASSTPSTYIFGGVAGYATSSLVAPAIVDIFDYTSTNKNKSARILTGFDSNGTYTGYVEFNSGVWMNSTTAINRIDIKMTGNFSTSAKFALYGVKA